MFLANTLASDRAACAGVDNRNRGIRVDRQQSRRLARTRKPGWCAGQAQRRIGRHIGYAGPAEHGAGLEGFERVGECCQPLAGVARNVLGKRPVAIANLTAELRDADR